MNLAFEILKPSGYVVVNKKLMKILGIDGALLFGELLSEYDYYLEHDQLTDDDCFFSKAENIENNISMSAYRQREAIKTLKSYGLVDVELRGVPAKNYYRLNISNIQDFLNSDVKNFDNKILTTVSSEKLLDPDVKNFDNSYKNNNIEKINNICVSEVKKEAKQKDVKNLSPLKALEVYKEEFDLSPEIVEALREFIDMRRRNKNNITALGLRRDLLKLFKLSTDPEEQLKIIYKSIDKCWKGFFELKDETRQGGYQQPNRYDRPAEPEEEDALTRIRKRLEAEEAARKEEEARQNEYD